MQPMDWQPLIAIFYKSESLRPKSVYWLEGFYC